jgi:hypothetical protein
MNTICIKKYFSFLLFLVLTSSLSAQINFFRNDNYVVLKSNGDTMANPWAGGFNYMHISEIDLNLDGINDLFAFDKQDNRIVPFLNSGIPNKVSYQHAPEYIQNFPELRDWVLLRDYNCDGKMDIFTYYPGGMSVYRNTSTSSLSFTLQTSLLYSNFQPNYVNLYVSSADIPAIDDIDGDGDLDILTFSILGSYVEYHKNLSMELYGTCDSLTYEVRNNCWGFFKENFSSNSATLYDTCSFNVPSPEKITGGNKHAGSTLLTLDVDSNDTKDLVLGDVSFNNFMLLTNSDVTTNMTGSIITAQDSVFPANNASSIAVDITVFPAGFYLDVDNDNVKDLIVSNNCYTGCENDDNVWYYKNNNADNKPDFDLQSTSFLQDGMIEVGEGAHPVFFDHNSDGLMDIVVGSFGEFDPSVGPLLYKSTLWLYENIGSGSNPAYRLIDSDYASISTINLDIAGNQPTLRLIPTFGDLDGDGDMDMIIGDYLGNLHYFSNSAGAGNTAIFSLASPIYAGIDVGNYASPQLIDLNRDNLLDLVIGNRYGYVDYYRNTGTVSTASFSLITDSLGYVKTRNYNEFNGNATPFIFEDSGSYKMIAGSTNGHLYYYDNIDGNLGGTFTVIDSMYLNIWEGSRSFVNIADITNDGKPDMLVGGYDGGVAFYEGDLNVSSSIKNVEFDVMNIYPNPTRNTLTIDLGDNSMIGSTIQIIDLLGKEIERRNISQSKFTVNLSQFSQGVYFLKFNNSFGSKVFKIIKE